MLFFSWNLLRFCNFSVNYFELKLKQETENVFGWQWACLSCMSFSAGFGKVVVQTKGTFGSSWIKICSFCCLPQKYFIVFILYSNEMKHDIIVHDAVKFTHLFGVFVFHAFFAKFLNCVQIIFTIQRTNKFKWGRRINFDLLHSELLICATTKQTTHQKSKGISVSQILLIPPYTCHPYTVASLKS